MGLCPVNRTIMHLNERIHCTLSFEHGFGNAMIVIIMLLIVLFFIVYAIKRKKGGN